MPGVHGLRGKRYETAEAQAVPCVWESRRFDTRAAYWLLDRDVHEILSTVLGKYSSRFTQNRGHPSLEPSHPERKAMRKIVKVATMAIVLLAALLLAGCATNADVSTASQSAPYGFWSGIWHGMIAVVSLFGSLISDNIAMYGKNNTGWWYDLGFALGAGIIFGGSSAAKD